MGGNPGDGDVLEVRRRGFQRDQMLLLSGQGQRVTAGCCNTQGWTRHEELEPQEACMGDTEVETEA